MARFARARRRGGRRAPLRKFVWARTQDVLSGPGTLGADLLEQFQTEYGAQLLGSTVVRIRGYVVPVATTAQTLPTPLTGDWGVIVESDNDLADPADITKAPLSRPHDDWLAWQPFWFGGGFTGPPTGAGASNPNADAFSVDIKSSRKIEELSQGLHIWYSYVGNTGVVDLHYDLSIGLKLP